MAKLYARFVIRILKHKWWVLWYGLRIGGIPVSRLIMHDMSKFSRAEFIPRFRLQVLKDLAYESEEFQAMCAHHHARNPHHWQHWVHDGVAQPIPEEYVREMVADWLAADKTYKVGLAPWLQEELPKMKLHYKTLAKIIPILASQGITMDQYWHPKKHEVQAPT